jgi:hypothetical protein
MCVKAVEGEGKDDQNWGSRNGSRIVRWPQKNDAAVEVQMKRIWLVVVVVLRSGGGGRMRERGTMTDEQIVSGLAGEEGFHWYQ